MFSLTDTVDLPNLANDPNKRYNAQIDLPIIGTDVFSQPFRRWSFFLTITASVNGAPFVGVNGFEPISQSFGTVGNILRASNAYNPAFEDYRAVLEPVQVNWKAIIGYDNLSAHVDPWGLPIAGSRIFPDFKNPLDTTIRHKLQVIVKTSAALAGKPVFVKAFDVDDSTSEAFDLPVVVDTNGKSGNDNLPDFLNTPQSGQFWTGTAWGGDTTQGIVDSNGEAKFDFRVGMQPGNNYRIVASVVDQSMITGVQVTNSTGGKYLGPALAQNAGAPATPLLTVWRRLWVENDSMAAIPVDQFGYKRNDLGSNLANPFIGTATLDAGGTNTIFPITQINDRSSFGTLENGKMIVQSTTRAVTSTLSSQGIDFVGVAGNFTTIPSGSGFRLYDDDDNGLSAEPLPRTDLVNQQMKDYFKTAFLDVTDMGGYNLDKYVPFLPTEDIFLNSTTLDDKKEPNVPDRNSLWVCHLIAAYQGPMDADKDPANEGESRRDGETAAHGGSEHSAVYVECCRELLEFALVGNNPALARSYLRKWITANASHEMGHQPGTQTELDDHNELGLMTVGLDTVSSSTPENSVFTPKTIRRFRTSNR